VTAPAAPPPAAPPPASGVIPVLPTAFHRDESLDLAGTARTVDFLIDSQSDALCVLANFSEQFSLTDEERDAVLHTVLERAAGRLPVVVTASHYSARIAGERCRAAQQAGAAMAMLMPPFFGATMTVPPAAVLSWFRTVADAAPGLPLMVQDAPLSPTRLPADLIARLAREIPAITHVKIETPGAAETLRALTESTALPGRFDGEEAVTLLPDLDAGATGTMCSATAPYELAAIVRAYHAGDRAGAASAWESLLPLLHHENRQCGPRAQKQLLAEAGIIGSARTRAPLGPLPPQTARTLLELARARDLFMLRWAE
jgi:4-hydroxy-tetrahydrodipicolinate synthase